MRWLYSSRWFTQPAFFCRLYNTEHHFRDTLCQFRGGGGCSVKCSQGQWCATPSLIGCEWEIGGRRGRQFTRMASRMLLCCPPSAFLSLSASSVRFQAVVHCSARPGAQRTIGSGRRGLQAGRKWGDSGLFRVIYPRGVTRQYVSHAGWQSGHTSHGNGS